MSSRIGIKLDLGFAENDVYQRLFGHHEILTFLHGIGVQAVETPVGAGTQDEVLIEHVRRCSKVGLRVSLHPYTELTPYNPAFFSHNEGNLCRRAHERFLTLAEQASQLQGAEAVVNIHSAAAVENTREGLLGKSIEFFRWAREWCGSRAPGVRVVGELQIAPAPGESVRRIGDSYAELTSVLCQSGVDACWDFGHAVMNTRRFGQPLEPPEAFLSRVAHVHCHDVDDEDHKPLIFGNVPWKRFLAMLANNGFDGTVILEVPATNFLANGGLDVLERSVLALKRLIEFTQNQQGNAESSQDTRGTRPFS
jgi:sugar phosphate isomerase/epimerase